VRLTALLLGLLCNELNELLLCASRSRTFPLRNNRLYQEPWGPSDHAFNNLEMSNETSTTPKVFGNTPKSGFLSRSLLDSFTTCKLPGSDVRDLHLFTKEPPQAVFTVLRTLPIPQKMNCQEKKYTHPIKLSCIHDSVEVSPLFSSMDPGGLYLAKTTIEHLKLTKKDTVVTRYGELDRFSGPVTLKKSAQNISGEDEDWLVTLPHVVQLPSHLEHSDLPQAQGILDIFTLRSHGIIFNNGIVYIVSHERFDMTFARFNPRPMGKRNRSNSANVKRKAATPHESRIEPVPLVNKENSPIKSPVKSHVKSVWDSDNSPVKETHVKSQFDSSDEDEAVARSTLIESPSRTP
jgi:hypothetical protein